MMNMDSICEFLQRKYGNVFSGLILIEANNRVDICYHGLCNFMALLLPLLRRQRKSSLMNFYFEINVSVVFVSVILCCLVELKSVNHED